MPVLTRLTGLGVPGRRRITAGPGLQPFVANLMGSSQTTDATATVRRSLQATLQGTSTTSAADALLLRRLTAQLNGTSQTTDATVTVEGQIVFSAALQGSSSTSASTVQVHRPLQASLASQSLTSTPLLRCWYGHSRQPC